MRPVMVQLSKINTPKGAVCQGKRNLERLYEKLGELGVGRGKLVLPSGRTHEFFALGILDTGQNTHHFKTHLGLELRRQDDFPALRLTLRI